MTHSLSWHGRCELETLIHFLFLIINSEREDSKFQRSDFNPFPFLIIISNRDKFKFQPDEKTFKSADSSISLVDCLLEENHLERKTCEENHLGRNVFIYRDEYVKAARKKKIMNKNDQKKNTDSNGVHSWDVNKNLSSEVLVLFNGFSHSTI